MNENISAGMLEKIEVKKPSHEEIAVAAYYIWLSEGCPDGCAERHWYEAEAQLMRMRQAEVLEQLKNNIPSCKSETVFAGKEQTATTATCETDLQCEKKESEKSCSSKQTTAKKRKTSSTGRAKTKKKE